MESMILERSWLLTALVFSATACWAAPAEVAGKEDRELVNVNARFAQMGFGEPTYADSIPAKLHTTFKPATEGTSGVDLVIDSSGGKEFFPIERKAREFADEKAMSEFMRKTFLPESKNGESHGAYLRVGDSYLFDPGPGIAYRVDDPILAYVGGANGVVVVGGKSQCIDPDGKCDSGFASYLVPVGQPTAFHQLDVCGTVIGTTPVCVRHHSFYNWTWAFGVYVRHGTNVNFTTWAALPSSEARMSFVLEGGSTSRVTRSGTVVGQNFSEIAIFCWFDCSHDVANAEQICSTNTVIDPDLRRDPVTTGNGPLNHSDTFFCTVFT
jgi:hypothetical protein